MEGTSTVMLDAEWKRGVVDSFVSPDGKLDAEVSKEVPSTTQNFPPRKQRRWVESQGSNSGNNSDAMI
eukprot:1297982-Heterocapsa_arctica.AAC.1